MILALDIETTGLDPQTDKIHGIGIANEKASTYYKGMADDLLRDFLGDAGNHIVGHNIRFDLKFLIKAGYNINCQIWDTKILAQLVDENRPLGLKELTATLAPGNLDNKSNLDRVISKAGVKHVGQLCALDMAAAYVPFSDLIAKYCIEDCQNTLALWGSLIKKAKLIQAAQLQLGFKKGILDYYVEEAMPLERVLIDMELFGIKMDVEACKKYRSVLLLENNNYQNQLNELCLEHINAIEEGLYEEARAKRKSEAGKANVKKGSEKYKTRFNWQSQDHLRSLFYTHLGIDTSGLETTKSGHVSIGVANTKALVESISTGSPAHKVLQIYTAWKKNLKLLTTYTGEEGGERGLLSVVHKGRVYAEYLQAGRGREGSGGGTVTGRLSSRNPNMQNLPRGSEIKRFFVPDPGQTFIYFDYAQLELRLAAHLSQDPLLLKGFNEGIDLHQMTADAIGTDRQTGKTFNFAMIYDASAWRLSSIINKSPNECQEMINEFFNLYSGYARYLANQKKGMIRRLVVMSEAGRIRHLPELETNVINSKPWKHAIKQGYNFPIQSLGATITKRAMIELNKAGLDIVTQVHDSVVVQVPVEAAPHFAVRIKHLAENIYPLSVPLKADTKLLTSLLESDILQIDQPKEIVNGR